MMSNIYLNRLAVNLQVPVHMSFFMDLVKTCIGRLKNLLEQPC